MVSRCLGFVQAKVQLHISALASCKGLLEYPQCPEQYGHDENSEKYANNRCVPNNHRDPLYDDVGMVV